MKKTIDGFVSMSAIFLFVAVGAAAQEVDSFQAGDLRDACQSLVLALRGIRETTAEDPGAMLCLGFLAGWTQAMDSAERRFADSSQSPPFCRPERQVMVPGEIAELLVDYIDSDADRRGLPAHEALEQALAEAFPCADRPAEGD